MSTVTEVASNTHHHIETEQDRSKFLRRVLRENGWTMYARADDDWQITFRRTIKAKPGDPNIDVVVTLDDKITLGGKYGKQRSFSDAEEVYIPQPTRVWLNYCHVLVAAKLLLDGGHFAISSSSGSSASSRHGLAFVSLNATVKGCAGGFVQVGYESVFINGKIVACGSVE